MSVPAAPDAVVNFTYDNLIPLWMNSLAENLALIRSGSDILDLPKKKGEPCICIGAGPSLDYHSHLSQIQEAGWKHPILCCDRKLQGCLKHGLKPYAVASVDGSPAITGFYSAPIIKKHAKDINAMLNVTTHPKVVSMVQKQNLKIYWYAHMIDNPATPDKKLNTKSIAYIVHLLTRKSMISAIGNVGSFLWNLAYELGCDPIILVGFDFSEQVADASEAIYFLPFTHMFMQKYKDEKKAMDAAAVLHQVEINHDFIAEKDDLPYYKKGKPVQYLVNPIWKKYRDVLKEHIISSGRHTINCTGNGCLTTEIIKCKNFEAHPLQKILENTKGQFF